MLVDTLLDFTLVTLDMMTDMHVWTVHAASAG